MNTWDKPGIPHKGWTWVSAEDLGESGPDYEPETCEMCGNEKLRYVHTMSHPEHDELRVGCVCAEHMAEDRVNPRRHEKRLVNLAKRRLNWLKRKWRRSAMGNRYLNLSGWNVTVFEKNGQFRYRLTKEERTIWGKKSSSTMDEAKLALFDELVKLFDW